MGRKQSSQKLGKAWSFFCRSQNIFDDPMYVDFYDLDHSEDEERYLIVGESKLSANQIEDDC